MSFNGTGKFIATVRGDETVRLVNAETGSELAKLAFENEVVSASLTSDDARLVVWDQTRAPELWDVGERRQLVTLADPGGVDGIEFDHGHRLVATYGVDGTYRVWDAENGTELHRFKGGCCLSGDGRLYLRREDNVIEIREIATDAVVSRLTFDKQPLLFSRLSPDGTRLAVTRGSGGELWDTAKQSLVARFDIQQALGPSFECTPNGKLLRSSGAGGVYLWDASTGRLIRQVSTGFTGVIFSSDGRLLATAKQDLGVVSVWNTETGGKVREIELTQEQEKQNNFQAIEFSPDGSRLAFGVGLNAQVWDIRTGQRVFESPVISDKYVPESLALSSDGSLLAAGSLDAGAGARVFDLTTGQERLRLQLDAGLEQLAFTADGKRLITYDSGHIARAWDTVTGQELFRFAHSGTGAEHIAYDAAKARVATSNAAVAQVWDTASGRKIADFRFDDRVEDIALNPNGTRLGIHKSDSSEIAVLRVDGGVASADLSAATLFTLRHEQKISAFAFSADGTRIVTGGEDDLRVWDATSGKELVRLNPQGWVRRGLLSDDNTVLAVSIDKLISGGRRVVEFWHVPTRQKLAVVPPNTSEMAFRPGTTAFAIADDSTTVRIVYPERAKPEYGRLPLGNSWARTVISPDGELIATRADDSKEAEIWDVETGKPRLRVAHDDVLSYIHFTAGGRLLTQGEDKTTRLWDTRTGRELLRLAPTSDREWLEFSPDGKWMGISRLRRSEGEEAQFELYDTESGAFTGKPIPIFPINGAINQIAISPDGRFLATGEGREEEKKEENGATYYVKIGFFGASLWDVQTGQEVMKLPHDHSVYHVAFSPDSTLMMTQTNMTVDPIRLWNIPAGKLVAELPVPEEDLWWAVGQRGAKFSTDGRLFAEAAGNELIIWRMTDYARVAVLPHKESVSSFGFSRDGRLLASEAGKELLVWDLAAGRAIVRLSQVESFQFTPDGKRLVAVHEDNTVRVWQLYADDLIADACSRLEANLSHEAWRTYLGEEPYRPTCPGLPVPER